MCDQKYKFCENPIAKEHFSTTDNSDEESDELSQIEKNQQKRKKKKKRKNVKLGSQTRCHDQVIFDQPNSCFKPHIKENSCCCHMDQSSTFLTSPSFNLRSNQKSTPKQSPHVCDATSHSTSPKAKHSSLFKQDKQNIAANNEIKTKSILKTETKAEINSNNIEIDDSFHSL